jgi:hypothetical protein
VEEMVAQRVYGLALGYEDLNDHEELRNDPLLAVLVEKSDPSRGALAGKSTTGTTAIYRCTSSAESSCCVRDCDRRTSMPQQEV